MEVKIVNSPYMEIFVKYLKIFPIYGKISVLKIIFYGGIKWNPQQKY